MKRKSFFPNARPFCLALLAAAFVYGLALPFCWGNDPSSTYGTLSLLCEDHIPFFWIWTVLTGAGLPLNLEYVFRKYGYAGKTLRAAAAFGLLGMVLTAATLNHSIQDWNPRRVLHWIGAICFGAGFTAAFLLFFLLKAREYKRFWVIVVLLVLTAACVLVQLLAFGRNGYMEIVPVGLLECILFVAALVPPRVFGAGREQKK